ncbi:SNF-related serine/threonine-protein kinase [Planoprotostelium fungivorum]|uniref:non-specific serine/threonine protein kinase n=1 Tax=Planoprotostelium fungivorum TaxID=1890364 RepID=A0A2P6NJE2_9EUKA|nr:SNF-related serine/threonine-protein kinase [Planoprotostelium fungivorum]
MCGVIGDCCKFELFVVFYFFTKIVMTSIDPTTADETWNWKPYHLRNIEEKDEYGLKAGSNSSYRDVREFTQKYEAPGFFHVLEDEQGDIIGTVSVECRGKGVAELRRLYLKTDKRGQGLGRKMLRHALWKIAQANHGVKDVISEDTSAESSKRRKTQSKIERVDIIVYKAHKEAISLYKKEGFTEYEPSGRCSNDLFLRLPLIDPTQKFTVISALFRTKIWQTLPRTGEGVRVLASPLTYAKLALWVIQCDQSRGGGMIAEDKTKNSKGKQIDHFFPSFQLLTSVQIRGRKSDAEVFHLDVTLESLGVPVPSQPTEKLQTRGAFNLDFNLSFLLPPHCGHCLRESTGVYRRGNGMGNTQSSSKKLFELLDRDHNGVITLEDLIQVQNLPRELGLSHEWAQSHSPLLLFRFDTAHEGCIDREEFAKLLRHLREASNKLKESKKREKKKGLPRSPSSGKLNCWTSVDEMSKIDLDRDHSTPMITGKKRHGANSPKGSSSDDLLEEEFKELVRAEARRFFEDLIKKPEGRRLFLRWLFHLTDHDHNDTITADELGNILDAVSEDGIMPEDLSFDPVPEAADGSPHTAAQQILQQYDTSHLGVLNREEFMVLADLILKNYELLPDGETQNHIGKYVLRRKLGTGAYGVVYMAVDEDTKAHRAIKMLNKGDVSDMSRVDQEIKAMLMLDHPNIVKLHEVLESDTNVFFVMELCGGGNLSNHIDEGPLAEEVARYYFVQLVKAVHYCHSVGVVHRDLKLENLLLDNDGELKVADFGHAGIFSPGWDVFSTGMVGSLWHISPEQLAGLPYSGEKIDLWAMGILLYRLLVGKPPFFFADPNEFVDAINNLNYELPFHLSMEVKHLFQAILQPKPEERIGLDDMLNHPWCQGAVNHPSLISQISPITSNMDANDLWKALKEVTKELNIHFLDVGSPDGVNDSNTLKGCKCTRLEKDLRFTIWLKVDPTDNTRFLEFDLKSGESIQLKNTVEKIKTRFAMLLKEVQQGKRVLTDGESDYETSDSDSSTDSEDRKSSRGGSKHDLRDNSHRDTPHKDRHDTKHEREGSHRDLRESGVREMRESSHRDLLRESSHKDRHDTKHEMKESGHRDRDAMRESGHRPNIEGLRDSAVRERDNRHELRESSHRELRESSGNRISKMGNPFKRGKSKKTEPVNHRVRDLSHSHPNHSPDSDASSDEDGYTSDHSTSSRSEGNILGSLKDALKTSLDFIKMPSRD